jgi:diguanylate cyclase (GGDEF)-like protein/PAS domain S-box-containing protein
VGGGAGRGEGRNRIRVAWLTSPDAAPVRAESAGLDPAAASLLPRPLRVAGACCAGLALLGLLTTGLEPPPAALLALAQALLLAVWFGVADSRGWPWRAATVAGFVLLGLFAWPLRGEAGSLLLAPVAAALLVAAAGRRSPAAALTTATAAAALLLLGALGLAGGAALGNAAPALLALSAALLVAGSAALLVAVPPMAGSGVAGRLAAIALALALIALAAWLSGAALEPQSDLPILLSMPPSAALAGLATAAALWLLVAGRRRTALLCLLPALVLAADALASAYLGDDSRLALGLTAGVGRFAPNTALGLLLAGLGMLLTPAGPAGPSRWAPSWACGLIVMTIAGIAVAGHLLALPTLHSWGDAGAMAPAMALMLALIGLGLSLAGAGQQRARRRRTLWVPLLAALAAVLASVTIWYAIGRHEARSGQALVEQRAERVGQALEDGLALHAKLLRRMAMVMARSPQDGLLERFEEDAAVHLGDFAALTSLALYDTDGALLRWESALADEGPLLWWPATGSTSLRMVDGRLRQPMVAAIGSTAAPRGHLVALFDAATLYASVLDPVLPEMPLRAEAAGRQLYHRGEIGGEARTRRLAVAGAGTITLHYGMAADEFGDRLALALLLAGLVGSGLLALALRLAALARERAEAAESISAELRAQSEQRRRAESALSASQRQIVDVLETVSDAVLMLDRDWRFVYLNPRAEALLRRRRRRLLGRVLWDVFPGSRAEFGSDFERALSDQVTASFERHYAPLQSWFEVRAYPHPHGLAVYFRDISERHRQEQELRQSEMLLEAAGRSARLGGWAIEAGSDRVRWTDEVCAIHEVPAGTSPTIEQAIDAYAPGSRELVRSRYQACLRDGTPWDEELELLTATGRRLWIRSIGKPMYDADGGLLRIHGAFQDISERKWAEVLLREVAEQKSAALESLHQIMDSATEVICVLDRRGHFVSINAASRIVWGYPPEALIGDPIERLVHPDDIAPTRAAIADVISRGQPIFDFRNRNLDADGRVVHMQWSASWSAHSQQLCCIGRDRSLQHRAECFEAGQREILAAIAAHQPLEGSLLALVRLYEAQFPGAHCALLRVEDGRMHCIAAPSLPAGLVAALDGRPAGAADAATDGDREPIAELAAAHDLSAGWSIPVRSSQGQVLASLDVFRSADVASVAEEVPSLDGIAALAAIAIEQAQAVRREQRNSLRLQRLAEAGVAINSAIGQPGLHRQLADCIRELIDAGMAVLSLVDGSDWAAAMTAVSLAPQHAHWQGFRACPDGRGIYSVVAASGEPLRLTQAELEAHPHFHAFSGHREQHPVLRGLLAVPLTGGGGRRLGVLMLSDRRGGEFDADDQAITLQFAQLASTALERSALIERLRDRDRFFDMARELFCVFDPASRRFLQVNPAFVDLLGYSEREILSRPVTEFIHPDDCAAAAGFSGRMDAAQVDLRDFVNRYVCADGSIVWLQWNGSADQSGHYHAIARNITERRRIELERDFATSHDPATGLPRFPLLEAQLAAELDRGRPLAVLFIDLDRFHGVNESMGHAVGDSALRLIAERMQAVLGDCERVARFAGDEFVAVVPELDAATAHALAIRLRAAIAEPIEGDGYRLYLTASIGISLSPAHGDTGLELLRRAEAAMGQAKRQGRDGICEFSEERMQELEDRRLLGSRLREAIGTGELSLAFQPRVRALDRRLTGFEALARWDSASLGSIPPDRFIPIAEALGLMPELGGWVLQQACRQIRAWLERGYRDFSVAVNVSAHQLQRPGLVEQVRSALAGERIPPHMLELELTESALMENVERVQATLAEIKQLGVTLALDDFGTGYSSLAYLKQFALDKLKIDRSFVTDLPHDAHDVAIARTIIAMGHQLKMVVAAEGVENEAQASFLRDIGCDELQGFHLGRPLPAAAAEPLFEREAALG